MDAGALLDNAPAPGATDMASRRQLDRRHAVVFLREGPAPRNDKARCEHTHTEHLPPLTKLQVVGEWVPNHPAMVDDEIHGVSVQDAEWEDARAMAEADPKVRAGYLTVGAIP